MRRLKSAGLAVATLCLCLNPTISVVVSPAIAQAMTTQNSKAESARLLDQGTRQYETAEYETAIKSLQQALKQYQQRNDHSGEIQVLIVLSEVHTELDKNDKALALGQEAVRLAQAGKLRLLEGRALTALGRALFQKQSDQTVQQTFEASLAIAREVDDRSGEGWALLGLSGVYLQMLKQPETAVSLGQQALKIALDLGDRRMEGRAFWRIGNALSDQRAAKEKVAAYQQGLTASRAAGDRRNTTLLLFYIGSSWSSVQEITQLLPYLREATELAETLPSLNLRYFTYSALGNAYSIVPGQSEKAVEPLQKALAIAQVQKNPENQYSVFSSLSIAYKNMDDFAKATKAATQLLKVAQELQSPEKQADAYKMLGLVASSAKNHQVSVSHYQQAITLYRQLNDYTNEAKTLNLLLGPLDGLKEYEQKLVVIRQILQLARSHPDLAEFANKVLKFQASPTFFLFGNKYASEKNYAKAIAIFEAFLAFGKEYNRKDLQADALDSLGSVYLQQQDYSKAIAAMQQGLTFAQESNQVSSQASINLRLGMIYVTQRNYAKAAAATQQAYTFSQQLIQDPFVNNPEQKGSQSVFESTRNHGQVMQRIALQNLTRSYQRLRNFPKAIEFAQLAIQDAQARNQTEDFSNASYQLVEIYTDAKQYADAVAAAQTFLKQAEQRNDRKAVATAHAWTAWVYLQAKDYSNAIQSANRGIAIAQQLKDERLRGWILNRLGEVYIDKGDYAAAISQAQTVLSLFPKLNAPNVEIHARANLGRAYFAQQEYAKATEQLQQGIAIAQKVENTDELARLWLVQGQVYGATQEYAKMLDALERSQENAPKLENAVRQSFILLNKALACTGLGSNSCVGESLQQVDTLRTGISSLGNQAEIEKLALLLASAGAFNAGDYSRSLALAQQILPLLQSTPNPVWEAYAYYLIAANYAELNDEKQAIAQANRSLAIAQTNQNKIGQANALYALAEIHRKFGQSKQAMHYYQAAIAIIPDQAVNAYSGLARLYREQQPTLAITLYKQSVNQIEAIRQKNRDLAKDLQESFLQSIQGLGKTKVADAYRELAEVLITQGRIGEAQQVLELLKVQELNDFNKSTRSSIPVSAAEFSPTETAILSEHGGIIAFTQKLANCEAQQCADLDKLLEQRDRLNVTFIERMRGIEQQAAKERQKGINDRRDDFTEGAEKIVKQPNTLLIYPLVLSDRVLVLWTATGKVYGATDACRLGQTQLWQATKSFHDELRTPGSLDQAKAKGKTLYNCLIAPLEPIIKANNIQHLVFAPDLATNYIPSGALYDGQQFLIERFTIANIVDARSTNTEATLPQNPQVLALGMANKTDRFPALPNVPPELASIVKTNATNSPGVFPGIEMLNGEFTKTALAKNLRRGDLAILHFATHAAFVPTNPDNSFLLLGDGNELKIPEIQNLDGLHKVHLVVLSACQTALGNPQDGVEVRAISSYFLSRAQTVVASLWNVNDASTALLMQQFYKYLANGMTKAEALKTVQQNFIQGKVTAKDAPKRSPEEASVEVRSAGKQPAANFSHPYYWAPFILIGNSL